jgi:protein gp37
MLNDQCKKKNGIETCDYTWNPISGCLHGCPYCYMNRMEKRFPGIMEPKFRPEYLEKFKRVRKVKPGDKIFVGSSGDMWGQWVINDLIWQVLHATTPRQDVTFQFLTKNPKRYKEWHLWPYPNCWFGTTVDGTSKTENNLFTLVRSVPEQVVCFVSFEPLLSHVLVPEEQWKKLDWIIIGADSTRGAKKPPAWWAESLIFDARRHGVPVWVKDNYGYPERIKEFPEVKK